MLRHKFRFSLLAVVIFLTVAGFTVGWSQSAALSRPAGEAPLPTQTHLAAPGLLFIGVSGLTSRVVGEDSAALLEQLPGYAQAALSPRSFDVYACPIEGWMQLRAVGDVFDQMGRAYARAGNQTCPRYYTQPLPGQQDTPASGGKVIAVPARIPVLATALEQVTWPELSLFDSKAWAIGELAGVPLAGADGSVPHWRNHPSFDLDEAVLRQSYLEVLQAAPSDVVIDLGSVAPAPPPEASQSEGQSGVQNSPTEEPASGAQTGTQSPTELGPAGENSLGQHSAAQILRVLVQILQANAHSTQPRPVVIASIGDTAPVRTLQFFATNSPAVLGQQDFRAALVYTSTTRSAGLVTMADVRSAVVKTRQYLNRDTKIQLPQGQIPAQLKAQAVASPATALTEIRELQRHADAALAATGYWYAVFHALGWAMLGMFILGVALSRPLETKRVLWRWLSRAATVTFAFIPAALILNLLPWWNLGIAQSDYGASIFATLATLGLAVVLSVAARFTPYPIGVLAGVTFALLCLDILAGSLHQRNGFMGSLVLSSRRYYGVSNRTYLILVIAGLLLLLPILEKWWKKKTAVLATLGVGAVALAVDALPAWGADFGGPPGILAAFLTVAVLAAGRRLKWWYVPLWLGITGLVMGAVALISAYSPNASHIGEFWSNLGKASNEGLIQGKIRDVLRSFTSHFDILVGMAVLAVGIALFAWLLRRYQRILGTYFASVQAIITAPSLRGVLLGLALGVLVAVPVNDSGAIMLKESFYMLVPALVAVFSSMLGQSSSGPEDAPQHSK